MIHSFFRGNAIFFGNIYSEGSNDEKKRNRNSKRCN